MDATCDGRRVIALCRSVGLAAMHAARRPSVKFRLLLQLLPPHLQLLQAGVV